MLNENKRHVSEMSIPHLGQLPHVPRGQLSDPPHAGGLCTTHFQKTIYLRNSKPNPECFSDHKKPAFPNISLAEEHFIQGVGCEEIRSSGNEEGESGL